MDRFEAYATFVAVAETRGFAVAARKLGRSAPAVTRIIAALEVELGTPLFRRTTRVVNLTEAGASFLASAKRILADVAEASAAVAGAHASLRGPLVVTASVMFGREHVAPILLRFLGKHPEIRARALLVDRVVELVDEGVDVAVRIAHLRDSTLRAARVGEVRLVTCASPAYLAARGTPRDPQDLAAHAVVAFAHGSIVREWSFPHARRAKRVVVEPRFITNSTETSIAAAVAGHGITRALSYQVAEHVVAGRLEVVLADHEPPTIPIQVVHAASPPARVRTCVDVLVEELRKDTRLRSTLAPEARKPARR